MSYLGRRSAAQFAALLAPHGLHPGDFGVLVVIAKRPGLTQQQLAEMSNIDRSSMVALLDELEARGLAERRPHPDDRRKRCIYLTSKGIAMMQDLQVAARRSGEES